MWVISHNSTTKNADVKTDMPLVCWILFEAALTGLALNTTDWEVKICAAATSIIFATPLLGLALNWYTKTTQLPEEAIEMELRSYTSIS